MHNSITNHTFNCANKHLYTLTKAILCLYILLFYLYAESSKLCHYFSQIAINQYRFEVSMVNTKY